jgi:hypothetical protein
MAGQSFFASDESAETIFYSLSLALCGQQAKLGEPKKSNPRKLVLHQLLADLFLGEFYYIFIVIFKKISNFLFFRT